MCFLSIDANVALEEGAVDSADKEPAYPHGGLTPAEAPLIDAENLFRQPGPPQSGVWRIFLGSGLFAVRVDSQLLSVLLDGNAGRFLAGHNARRHYSPLQLIASFVGSPF